MEPPRKIQLYNPSLLRKGRGPSPKDAMRQVWLKLTQWFWRRKWKCEKFMTATTTTTTTAADKFWSEKLTWAFGSGELKKIIQSMAFSSYDIIRNQHDWCNLIVNGNVIWISSVKHTMDFLSSFFWKENWTRDSETALKPDLSMLQYKT